jgi:hypothetical protein
MIKGKRLNADGTSTSILDTLTGGKDIGFAISLDPITVSYLGIVALATGVILILISKKVIK